MVGIYRSEMEAEAPCDSAEASKRSRYFLQNSRWVYQSRFEVGKDTVTKCPARGLRSPPRGAKPRVPVAE